jgi:hypothetical protein
MDFSPKGVLIEDIKRLRDVRFRFVRIDLNQNTHNLAREVRTYLDDVG